MFLTVRKGREGVGCVFGRQWGVRGGHGDGRQLQCL